MSDASPSTKEPAACPSSRRWLVAVFFLCWTTLALLALWWLVSDAASSRNAVIRVGTGEAKVWSVRLLETVALARVNFPWALAWLFLSPYVLWVGVRFHFEGAFWRSRLPVLLVSGVGFVVGSQWLAQRLSGGQAMIVMVKYTADTAVEKLRPLDAGFDDATATRVVTNHLVTNRITRIMISGEAASTTNRATWEMTTGEVLSGLATNLPHLLARDEDHFLSPPGPIGPRRWSAVLDGFAYVALIGLAHAGVFYRRYREREQQAALLEARLNRARLRALQAQLQPHFLFNTLNGIATLLRRDPARAEEMLLSLSELLRIALSSSHRQEIPLREEMNFLGRYLAIQRMRFGDRLQVTEEIEPLALDCLVPALLLQPIVENAIRHGLEPSGQPGQLRIAASRKGEWLRLTVEDNGVGLPSGEQGSAGVGLTNVRERLNALHGTEHEFNIAERPGGGVVVSIKLPARTAENETTSLPGAPDEPRRSGVSVERRKHSQAEVSGALPRRRYGSGEPEHSA